MESPAASDNVFAHEPLPDPAKYMRLLEVLDDNYSETTKVKCRLTTWPIDSMPPYHAVSYTWGDPKSNTLILMNDKTLEVRTNCEFALKQAYWYRKSQSYFYRKWQSHLYRETRSEWYTKSRYFWLDALCIDQSNLKEKSKQVAMMGSIYKKASHVLACIGDHADDS
ncbi:heterokaryon incompatibility protein-domain-containing protein, partial [Diaporthe sp. PMI_573]